MLFDARLNEEQIRAVTLTEGPLRVIAGAGTGKTRALTNRYAYLVTELGILPENILCVTFTNKAAGEMRQRIRKITAGMDTGYINTFHGFCVTVLQEDIARLAWPKSFLVLDNGDIDEMLGVIYEERGLTMRDSTYAEARDGFEIRKGITEPDYYRMLLRMSAEELRQTYLAAEKVEDILFYGYLWQQKKCFALDYNDLLFVTLHLMEVCEDVRLKWQERLEYILIDEFQDIDAPQYRLMRVLSGGHGNLFAVGDPDQTVYSWRGASPKFLMGLDRDYPGTSTVVMTKNYRSTPQILHTANTLIAHNKERIPKDLTANRPDGPEPECFWAPDPEEEAKGIVSRMRRDHAAGVKWSDMTVLYRAHWVTGPLEEELIRSQIPYNIYSGVPFWQRREIKDALCYMRLAVLGDDLSFQRVANVPKRNLGKTRMAFLEERALAEGTTLLQTLRNHQDAPELKGTGTKNFLKLLDRAVTEAESSSVSDFLGFLLEESGYEKMLRTEGSQERLDNLSQLKRSVYEYEIGCGEECSPTDFVRRAASFTNADAENDKDRVKLMTIHAAKGLEFSRVYLMAMNEGVLPGGKTRTPEGLEEERRLAFVAITRAKDAIVMSLPLGFRAGFSPRYPSRFLLEAQGLNWEKPLPDSLIKEARAAVKANDAAKQAPVFEPGTRVRHAVFGVGTVLEADREKAVHTIRFDSLPTPRKISFRAKLEPEK